MYKSSLPAKMSARAFQISRWLRGGLLLLPLLMGVALVGGALSNRQRVYEASELLVRGQVDSFVRSLAQVLRSADGPMSEEVLNEALEELRADGLRYVALLEPDAKVRSQAGKGRVKIPLAGPLLKSPSIVREGDRVRVTLKLPSGRLRRLWRQQGGRRFDARQLPPWLALEIEPELADRLRKDADRAFGLSALTAVVLMLIAGMLWWQLRRRESLAEAIERERRLAQLGEMSAVLAHEMRNPLASLKGHAQLLVEQLPQLSSEIKKAQRIVTEAARLEELSSTLLDFVRSGSVERERVDVSALVRRAASEVGAERIRLTTSGLVERPVMLDPRRMNQVLVNLFDNALEASPDDQPVDVTLEVLARGMRLRIRDYGEGLGSGEEHKVFEAFHTNKTHGTGLGLAIARRIVELHGGTLTAHNHDERGAIFIMEIPG